MAGMTAPITRLYNASFTTSFLSGARRSGGTESLPNCNTEIKMPASEDRSRCSRAHNIRLQQKAEHVSSNAGQQVHGKKIQATKQSLGHHPQAPENVHVGSDVNDPYVHEDGSHQPPPLAFQNDPGPGS